MSAREPLLSEQDLCLLHAVAQGRALDVIARELDVSDRTIRRRTRGICERLDVGTTIEAVVWAVRRGLL